VQVNENEMLQNSTKSAWFFRPLGEIAPKYESGTPFAI